VRLGDALGFPVEGAPPEMCALHLEGVERGELRGRPPFPFGQYTDDTQLARELLASLVERGGLDPVDYAARIASLFAEDRVVGRGIATSNAAARLARGVPWDEAGEPPPSGGNGSAMRAAPIGLFFAGDLSASSASSG
jgi:ADP-ribosylglycohydrolase